MAQRGITQMIGTLVYDTQYFGENPTGSPPTDVK